MERLGAGWAVNGVAATLGALARGQVRSLLVNADAAMPGLRFSDTGRSGSRRRTAAARARRSRCSTSSTMPSRKRSASMWT